MNFYVPNLLSDFGEIQYQISEHNAVSIGVSKTIGAGKALLFLRAEDKTRVHETSRRVEIEVQRRRLCTSHEHNIRNVPACYST
jgi:hypothetical protein